MKILSRDVLEYVAAEHRLGMDTLLSSRRTRDLARPRQIAMYVMRQVCPHLSYPEIGRRMGGRDHTTILHGVRQIEALIAVDPEVARIVSKTLGYFTSREGAEGSVPADTMDRALSFYTLCASYERVMRQAA